MNKRMIMLLFNLKAWFIGITRGKHHKQMYRFLSHPEAPWNKKK